MRRIRVTRADVYAARTRIGLDAERNLKTPGWVTRLAAVLLPHERRR